MTLEECQRRLSTAQTAIVYVMNILKRHEQCFISENYCPESQRLTFAFQSTVNGEKVWDACKDIQWYMAIAEMKFAVLETHTFCSITIDLKGG